jgi:hypothetical protein
MKKAAEIFLNKNEKKIFKKLFFKNFGKTSKSIILDE